MTPKKIQDIMVSHPIFIDTCTTLQQAAQAMKDADCSILHVGAPDKHQGIITDRDLVIRAIINGRHAGKPVSDYMERQIIFCDESDSLEYAYELMKQHKIERLLVKDQNDAITGVVSMASILENRGTLEQAAVSA